MLYVVAWPVLAEADDTALRRLRAQYHPREADLIGPHLTLVFDAPLSDEDRLRTALAGLADRRPFWFVLERSPSSPIGSATGTVRVYAEQQVLIKTFTYAF